jgi:hypothetical protein
VLPEDVLLIQLWLEQVKEKVPTIESSQIEWGKQSREGVETGHGMPLTIQEGDRLQIIIKDQKKITAPSGGKRQVVEYMVGSKKFQATMKSGDTVEKLLNEIGKVQNKITVERVGLEDGELMMAQTLNEIDGRGGISWQDSRNSVHLPPQWAGRILSPAAPPILSPHRPPRNQEKARRALGRAPQVRRRPLSWQDQHAYIEQSQRACAGQLPPSGKT